MVRLKSLDVALTRRDPLAAEVIIVIDCIRATTTIDRAISAGYEQIFCVGSVNEARGLAAGLDRAVLGGERRGVAPRGFDLGNSPRQYESPIGRVLVLTTTNGTRAILKATREAQHVLIGSLASIDAVSACALDLAKAGGIAIRCAGVRGEAALDDVAVAGRFVERLIDLDEGRQLTDASRVALATSRAHSDITTALVASRSALDLEGTGHEADVLDCARENLTTRIATVAEHYRTHAVITRLRCPEPAM